MKLIISLGVLLFSLSSFSQLANPQETFRTYLKSMVEIKNGTDNKSEYFKKAISTFDLSNLEKNLHYDLGKKYAITLIRVLDKIKKVNYDQIPTLSKSAIWYFDRRMHKADLIEISLIQKDQKWYFSKETFKSLPLYETALASAADVDGVIKLTTITDKLKAKFPPVFLKKQFLLENWQWPGFLLIVLIAFLLEKIVEFFTKSILLRRLQIFKHKSHFYLEKAVRPFGKVVFILSLEQLLPLLDLQPTALSFFKRGISIALSCFMIWLFQKIISLAADHFQEKAKETDTKFDDILIPLLTKTSFILLYLIGAIVIANALTVDVSSLIAGLGIGGLAFAFAAKDTLANFFGSIMLVLDRPFDIGDVIQAGDIQGTVVEVGFRSTRIRTFYDSIITISNGQLMNRSIDNQGKRRFRRLSSTLGLEYNTPPEKIEAFCEGVRQIILSHEWTRKDYFNVYFTNFGASSLDIQLMVFWDTNDYTREQSEKHRLMIDILRLSQELNVQFAFPTQTLHVYNESTAETNSETFDSKEYFDKGISSAKAVTEKPLSLKNPRSNGMDTNQFGKNDIGLK